jgi:hypothetical protein
MLEELHIEIHEAQNVVEGLNSHTYDLFPLDLSKRLGTM